MKFQKWGLVPALVISALSASAAHDGGPGHSFISHAVPALVLMLVVALLGVIFRRPNAELVKQRTTERRRRRAF